VLDASLTAHEALERIAVHSAKTHAVIRRVAGHDILFNLIAFPALRETVSAARQNQPLEEALDLAAQTGTRLRQVNQAHNLDLEPMAPEVLVDGFEVVGALVASPKPDAPATDRRASSASRASSLKSLSPLSAEARRHDRDPSPPELPRVWKKEPLPYKRFLGIKIYPTTGSSGPVGPAIVQVAPATQQQQQAQATQSATVMVKLQAPQTVRAGEPFQLGIRFAPVIRDKIMSLGEMIREAGRRVVLKAQVIADRFEKPGGSQEITVPLARPDSANLNVPMVAPAAGEGATLARLMVLFSAGGRFAGTASHRMAVASREPPSPARAGLDRVNWLQLPGAQPLWAPADETPADLSVILVREEPLNNVRERYQVRFLSPHSIDLPSALTLSLDRDAATFALELIKDVNQHQADVLISNVLKARARKIAGLLPPAFWEVLRRTWDHVQATNQRAPSVLWVSSEHHIPWELCYLDQPLDPAQPPFLGAQVALGRWVLSEGSQPQPWPYQNIEVQQMAVMIGDYAAESGLRPLPHAQAEGEALEQEFQAKRFTVSTKDLKRLVDGKLGELGQSGVAQVVHFACHGEAAPTIIYLDQGTPFTPIILESADWPKTAHPFLFMNACQVGNAGEFLGECAGFAGSSLRAGFAGFLGPLWSVVDADAKDFALHFYELAFAGQLGRPLTVGEILRRLRAGYDANAVQPRVTPLAYAFYGNPALQLVRGLGATAKPAVPTTAMPSTPPSHPHSDKP